MKRICIITTQHSVNDMRVTHRIAKTFRENGYTLDWYGPFEEYNSDSDYGINFHYLNSKNRFSRNRELLNSLKSHDRYDLYWSVDPDSAFVCQKIAKLKDSISVFDVHERYHDDIVFSRISNKVIAQLISRIAFYFMKYVIRNTDVTVGVGQTRLDPFLEDINKSFIIKHYLPLSFSDLKTSKTIDSFDKTMIMHGKAAKSRGTEEVIQGIIELKNLNFRNFEVQFFKLGGIQSKANIQSLENRLMDLDISQFVKMRDQVSFEIMTQILRNCHIGVIAYSRDLGVNAMPNRFFEYIAFGMPVVFPIYSQELMAVHNEFDIGIPVDVENPKEIANAILHLVNTPTDYNRLSENCISAFKALNFENEFKPFLNWFSNIK